MVETADETTPGGRSAEVAADTAIDTAPPGNAAPGYAQTALGGWAPLLGIQRPNLADRFIVPPFSVLDARQGYWQERKRRWLDIGLQSELGRGDNLQPSGAGFVYKGASDYGPAIGGRGAAVGRDDGKQNAARAFDNQAALDAYRAGHARAFNLGLGANAKNGWALGDTKGSGTSIFDPVLCELAYRWFTPTDGAILDPFAGGSVRGIVAAALGRDYLGIDLSARQLDANRAQAAVIIPDRVPFWICGDSRAVTRHDTDDYDFIFSCPPYADLEQYSDDPRDLSNMDWEHFLGAYFDIIGQCTERLRPDRFACFVVGDVRDKQGHYRNLPGATIMAFDAAGMVLYNDAVLVTAVGSLPIRVGRQFDAGRKLGTTHQRALVFLKGDSKRAAAACDTVNVEASLGRIEEGANE